MPSCILSCTLPAFNLKKLEKDDIDAAAVYAIERTASDDCYGDANGPRVVKEITLQLPADDEHATSFEKKKSSSMKFVAYPPDGHFELVWLQKKEVEEL